MPRNLWFITTISRSTSYLYTMPHEYVQLPPRIGSVPNVTVVTSELGDPTQVYTHDVITHAEVLHSASDPYNATPWPAKPCYHYKWDLGHQPCDISVHWPASYGIDEPIGHRYGYFPSVNPILYIEQALLTHPSWNVLPDLDQAVQNALPSFRNEFSLLNAILEADDIPRIWNDLMDAYALRRSRAGLRTGRRNQYGLDDLHLSLEFGVDTLLMDLEALFRQLNRKYSEIAEINDRLQRGVKASSGVGSTDEDRRVITLTYPIASSDVGAYIELKLLFQFRWTCRVVGSFSSTWWRYLLDIYGLYPDLATFWEAVPYTWLLDYVLPVDEVLSQRAQPWSKMNVRAVNGCRSVKVTGTYNIYVQQEFESLAGYRYRPVSSNWLGGGNVKFYLRELVSNQLDGIDFETVGGPMDDNQIRNSLALASSRIRRAPGARYIVPRRGGRIVRVQPGGPWVHLRGPGFLSY